VGMSKMTLDLKADQEELDRCFSRLRSYTPLSFLDELKEDMADKASAETTQQLRNDLGLQRQEVKAVEYDVKKLREFQEKTTADLKDKPSQAFVAQTLSIFKETLLKTQQSLSGVDAKLEKVSTAQAGELKELAARLDKC